MVIDDIVQSQLFNNVTSIGKTAINTSVVTFNNFSDKKTDDTASHEINDRHIKLNLISLKVF